MCVVSVLVWFWKDLWIMQSNTKCMYYASLQTDTVLPAYISAIAPTANNQNAIIFVPTGVSLANFPQNPSWIYGEQKGGKEEEGKLEGKKKWGNEEGKGRGGCKEKNRNREMGRKRREMQDGRQRREKKSRHLSQHTQFYQ